MENNNKKNWTIYDIESLDSYQAFDLAKDTMTIKDYDIYFVDFEGYFGYSALVFRDDAHIHYANEYELHHGYYVKNHGKEALKQYYIEKLNNKLFTEDEIKSPLASYDEYTRKTNFLTNYYGMQKPYISIFFIGSDEEREKRRKKTESMFYDPVGFAYYNDKEFVKKHVELREALDKRRNEMENNLEYWKEAILYEMWNHEYGINWDGDREVRASLGLSKMNDVQKLAWKQAKAEYFKKFNEED